MNPVELLKVMFQEHFDSPVLRVEEMSAQLGGSARRMLRLSASAASAVGVLYDVREENAAFVGFSKHFRKQGLPVPEIYGAELDQNVYLQEDLGNVTLFDFLGEHRTGDQIEPDVLDAYRRVVAMLPRFQVEGGQGLDYSLCYPRASFDDQSITWDLNYFKYCFLRPAGIRFNEQALEDDFSVLTDFLLGADCSYFLYRDFQSRNIMLREGQPYFIDYQGGRRGALQYDIASLLYDAKASLPPSVRDELLRGYLDSLASVIELDRDRFMEHYYAYAYVRIMQALGAYGFLGIIQRQQLFLDSVPYALRNLSWLMAHVKLPVATPELMGTFERMIAEGPAEL
jgi:aminoglycoside/choline kinase family phosphotransferase